MPTGLILRRQVLRQYHLFPHKIWVTMDWYAFYIVSTVVQLPLTAKAKVRWPSRCSKDGKLMIRIFHRNDNWLTKYEKEGIFFRKLKPSIRHIVLLVGRSRSIQTASSSGHSHCSGIKSPVLYVWEKLEIQLRPSVHRNSPQINPETEEECSAEANFGH